MTDRAALEERSKADRRHQTQGQRPVASVRPSPRSATGPDCPTITEPENECSPSPVSVRGSGVSDPPPLDSLNPPQATRLQCVVRRVSPPVETDDDKRTHVYHRTLASGTLWLLFGNGDVSGWRGKRNRPRWKTSTEWQRRETVANHAAGLPTPSGRGPAPSAPTRSLEVTRCGSTESRENNWIHLGPRGRNGSLGAKLVNGRVCPEAAPLQWWQSVHEGDRPMNDDRQSLLPGVDFTRRGFVVTSLASGFALAAQPISAQTTVTTDTNGLKAGEVKIPVTDGRIPAYRAMPAAGGPFPVVLVVQEIFGVHEHIKDICRRLAKLGYLAVAPELYARQGDVSKIQDFHEIVSKVVSKVPDAQVMSDLDATVAWVKDHGKGNTAKLGITGYCWGGRIVWLYAAHNPDLKAGVAWYGRLVGQPDELHPKNPIDLVGALHAPVLGLYGEADQGIPVASVEQMRTALKEAGKPAEIIVYPDTPHAFFADYRPSFRKDQAADGWKRLLAWFKTHGVS